MFDIKDRELFFKNFSNKSFEPFLNEYTNDLIKLIEIIRNIGKPVEGSIFFNNNETDLRSDNLSDTFKVKRRTLALTAIANNKILEIGFNAGFSALLMLTANPNLRLVSADICMHPYTIPCFEYLKERFGDRLNFIAGNSLESIPAALSFYNDYNVYIIDGGHGLSVAEADLATIIANARPDSLILFDDSDWPELRAMLDFYMLGRKLLPVSDVQGFIHNTNQMFFRVL
jgi:hypothetical protein